MNCIVLGGHKESDITERLSLLRLNQEEIGNMSRTFTSNEIESLNKNSQQQTEVQDKVASQMNI